ncbi:jg4196 [Pararge aegeria aegeria]|uniref:Jg4196 protein n=1 Tax=Pararge aegeria aegeria TaxID=348720 RepID=A0A8S4R840_9NEOP|nr:jg4196 [Pararge aegeria aegeria]
MTDQADGPPDGKWKTVAYEQINQLLQLIMMGKVEVNRRVGRRKMSWLRNIREWTNIVSVQTLFRLAQDREKFAELTANLQ